MNLIIPRKFQIIAIKAALKRSPVVAILGPRQCGKTTLARAICDEESGHYFDLEHPVSLARLREPLTALEKLTGLVVIDEIQRKPELFELLRVLADRTAHGRCLACADLHRNRPGRRSRAPCVRLH